MQQIADGIYQAVGDEGIAFADLAAAIGRGVGVPAVSKSRWGAVRSLGLFLGMLAGMDQPASSRLTRQALGWEPSQPGLIDDLTGEGQGTCREPCDRLVCQTLRFKYDE